MFQSSWFSGTQSGTSLLELYRETWGGRSPAHAVLGMTTTACQLLPFGNTYRYKTRSDSPPRLCSVLISTASSDGSLTFLESSGRRGSPLLGLDRKTVGIIGGASSSSTLVFLKKLVRWSSKDGDEPVAFVACNDPDLNSELTTSINSFSGPNRVGVIIDNLRQKRLALEKAGAGCVVIPCHLLHIWHKEVSEGCELPFLHAGECVSRELKMANLRPLEKGSNIRVGILGTDSVLKARTYQDKLERQGLEAVLPDKHTVERLVVPAIKSWRRRDIEGARNLLRVAIQVLLVRAVNVVVMASDEMQGILPPDDLLLKKCVDPMDSLARSTIEWAKSK